MKKKMHPAKSAGISTSDWLANKPYEHTSEYDRPYLKLCEKVFDILNTQKEWFEDGEFNRDSRKALACIIVSYFEDFINEIGIWRAFIDFNLELHGSYLPFYDQSDYDPDYLNIEDIAYLIWHFMTKNLDTRIYAPDSPLTMALAAKIYDVLEPEIENVPASDFYEEYLSVEEGSDFFQFKSKLLWFAAKSYLMGREVGPALKDAVLKYATNRKTTKPSIFDDNMMLYTIQEDYIYSKRCSFAAMNAPTWFSKIARCTDKKQLEINNLQYRHQGTYLFQGEDEKYALFTHVVTDREYKVFKDSFKQGAPLGKVNKTAFIMTLIQWEGEWMLTGTMAGWTMSARDLEQQKAQPLLTPWVLPPEKLERMRETTNLMYQAFLEYFGSPLALFNNRKEFEKASGEFFQYYNQQRGGSKKDFERRKQTFERKFDKLAKPAFEDLPSGSDYGLIFLEGVGIVTLFDLKDTLNGLTKENPTKMEEVDLFYDLMANHDPDVAEYFLQRFGHKNFKNPNEKSGVNAWETRHFYWRFYHPGEFGDKYPMINEIDLGI